MINIKDFAKVYNQNTESATSSQSARKNSVKLDTYAGKITEDIKSNAATSTTSLGSGVSLKEIGASITPDSVLASMTGEMETAKDVASATTESSISLGSMYQHGVGRLVDFTYSDGSEDVSKRAYMQLKGEVSSMSALIAGENKELLQSVYSHLIDGYTSIIITGMQENLQERQSLMTTVGDSFALTFSGMEPQIIVISGYLPFDNSAEGSWFLAFLNAYKRFIRASKLAEHRCNLRLIFPDFIEYTCYPVAINNMLNSETDNIIPFSMTAIVVENSVNKAYGYDSSVSEPTNTAEEVEQETSAETLQEDIEKEVTKAPEKVAQTTQKQSFVDSVSSWVNKVTSSKELQDINKVLTIGNQIAGAISSVTGKPYGSRHYSGKVGRGTYD